MSGTKRPHSDEKQARRGRRAGEGGSPPVDARPDREPASDEEGEAESWAPGSAAGSGDGSRVDNVLGSGTDSPHPAPDSGSGRADEDKSDG